MHATFNKSQQWFLKEFEVWLSAKYILDLWDILSCVLNVFPLSLSLSVQVFQVTATFTFMQVNWWKLQKVIH